MSAQDRTTDSEPQRPKVGLALSGGGAKGLAHIGVLKVLEEVNMPIDYITGTSMGAMIGGLYSIGYSPEYLQDLSNNLDWSELFSDEVYRRYMPMEDKYWDGRYLLTLPFSRGRLRLPRGLVAGQQISMLLSNLTWQFHGTRDFLELPIPFACIATDLDSGEAVLMNEGVLSESIRASISIPTIFTPVRIDGKTLIDGGVARNLPVSDVRDMGADIVIGINVTEGLKHSDNLRTILDIMDQTVGFRMYQSVSDEVELADIIIEPDVRRFSILDFQSTMMVIDEGERAAREMYDELKALADSLNAISEWRQRDVIVPDNIESVRISGIRINGLHYYSEDRLRSELQLEIGANADPQMISSSIERLYSMQYFRHINYYLEPDNASGDTVGIAAGEESGSTNISGSSGTIGEDEGPVGYKLNINVTEREQSTFSFGFRYDNNTSASLLFNNTFRNLITASSTLQLNARLGQEISLDAQLIRYIGASNQIGFQGRMNYLLEVIDIYNDDGIRVSRFDNNSIFAELMFFPVASSSIMIGGGFREELYSTSSTIGFFDFDQRWSNLNLLNGLIWIDTMDRTFFPRRGHTIWGQALRAFSIGDDARSFLKLELIWNSFYELGNRTSLTHRGHAGYINGNSIPLHHQLHMSGDLGFMGLRRYEISANNMRWMQLGIRYEFYESTYIHPVFNVGNTRDVLDFNLVNQSYHWGWGVSFGMQTLIAPVQFTFMGGDRHDLLVMFSIGFTY